jgi:alpha-ketoglutarate-dependent taurine dioxygenase
MLLRLTRLSEFTGAELTGIDLSEAGWITALAQIRRAVVEHSVLVVRDQCLSMDQQLDLSRNFGSLEEFPEANKRSARAKAVFRVANVSEGGIPYGAEDGRTLYLQIVEFWHTDSSYRRIPAKFSFLHAIEVPPVHAGGQTEWANTAIAYARLADAMKLRIQPLRALHSYAQTRIMVPKLPPLTQDDARAYPPVLHPVVTRHPETDNIGLFISQHSPGVMGIPADQGRALMQDLIAHATQPMFVYRHVWRKGDLLIWDNRHTMHRVIPYDYEMHTRIMHRTSVSGELLVGTEFASELEMRCGAIG